MPLNIRIGLRYTFYDFKRLISTFNFWNGFKKKPIILVFCLKWGRIWKLLKNIVFFPTIIPYLFLTFENESFFVQFFFQGFVQAILCFIVLLTFIDLYFQSISLFQCFSLTNMYLPETISLDLYPFDFFMFNFHRKKKKRRSSWILPSHDFTYNMWLSHNIFQLIVDFPYYIFLFISMKS